MKHLTATDLDALAYRLQIMRHSVLEELRRTAAVAEISTQSHEVRSHADEAEAERLGDLRVAEFEIDRSRLKDIEEALHRMAEGRYGICADCEDDIPRERLVVQPTAIRCAACQATAEARHRL
jgi:RNA polymerase-binding protein DksA